MTIYTDIFDSQQTEGVLSEIISADETVNSTLTEAVRRIEEANLWKTLMVTPVFREGSARPEIVNSVNQQIQDFARQKLEECVGISQPQNKPFQSIFSEDELNALKILANKMLQKEPTIASRSYTPTLNPISSTDTKIKTSVAAHTPQPQPPKSKETAGNAKQPEEVKSKKISERKKNAGYIPQPEGYSPITTANPAFNVSGGGGGPVDVSQIIQGALLK